MELSELTEKVQAAFEITDIGKLSETLLEIVLTDDTSKYELFENLVKPLDVDWLQMIYQYWLADRENKKQDFTPKSLALFLAKMITPEYGTVVDMCAGSGALTIQAWAENPNLEFECIEFDENVIPILLFNLAVRNIKATVRHQDVLSENLFAVYTVEPREKYGKVMKIETSN
jgi:type I restriction-modification system DNA methylase subunit